jgi:hypothetical protein
MTIWSAEGGRTGVAHAYSGPVERSPFVDNDSFDGAG